MVSIKQITVIICIGVIILFLYFSADALEEIVSPFQQNFSQLNTDLQELKQMLGMYTSNIKPPHNKEERCHQLNGHIGSVINRAIEFCG